MSRYLNIATTLIVTGIIISITTWNLKKFQLTNISEEHHLFDGSQARELEAQFEKSLIISKWSKGLWAAIDYALLKEGYKGVVVGKDGWLFSSEEYYVPKQESRVKPNISYVKNVASILSEFNIALKVVLIPEKAEVYSEYAPKQLSRGQLLREKVTSALNKEDVFVIDLYSKLARSKSDQQVFLKTDTHWTPLGAKIAAREIAQSIPLFGKQDFNTVKETSTVFRGDLFNFIPVAPYFDQFGPEPDRLTTFTTSSASTSEEDLLFSPISEPPIALVGTSYSANSNWNFPGFLREFSKQDILNLSTEGEGPFEPMKAFISENNFSSTNIKIVLWEIPIRYFESKDFYATK
ncbi:hypothetical protein H2O73_18585 [Vibrio sp. 404]|uniref:AlgX/AlgJ SGNH hydrolase-like domain-containing protein n=1 Tax=Vibrio marinisediminis TaxID=2758441 RepID=A0A7W2FUA1_9VIBR|nr:hypothetical protein [Vibrio marinisediminis]MBA5764366.1 hypothetical protein [Vibrio marinisediminis]